MIRAVFPLLRLCLALLLGAALTGSAFAHRAQITPQQAAFYAAGGTDADLCGGGNAHLLQRGCEACRLVATALIPDLSGRLTELPLCIVEIARPVAPYQVTIASGTRVLRTRAPPALSA